MTSLPVQWPEAAVTAGLTTLHVDPGCQFQGFFWAEGRNKHYASTLSSVTMVHKSNFWLLQLQEPRLQGANRESLGICGLSMGGYGKPVG